MSEPAPAPGIDPVYWRLMGHAALLLRNRRDLFRVLDGARRLLGERSPRPALDLKIVRKENP
jgi:hypothetical protein